MAFRRGFRRGGFREHREINLDQAAEYLQEVVSRVKANPDEFEALKKVFKKNVPLTMRSWVAAYLLRNSSGSIAHFGFRKEREEREANGEGNERRDFSRRYSRDENQAAESETSASTESSSSETREPRERFTRVEIAPDQAASIFVGVGRNRRVFPRDLVGLFISQAGIEKERIGHITVLANYSFVQLFKEDADKAINALNGYMFRGRPLSVSYSRNEDGNSAESASETKPAETQAESTESASSENYENNERVPNVSNESAPIADSFTKTNNDTMAEQAAFAKAQAEMTDEEILAARRPRSSSSEDVTN